MLHILSGNLILQQHNFLCFNCSWQRRYFLFHLPQSLSLVFFNGRDILEASTAFIIVKRIRGFFYSFCIDHMYFTSQKVSLHSFFLSVSKQLTFMHFVDFPLLFPSSSCSFPSFHKTNCVRHYDLWWVFSNFFHQFYSLPQPKYYSTCNCVSQYYFH